MTEEAKAPSAIEQTPAELEGWSPEDIAWLKKLPEQLQPLAVRHGREVWSLAMQLGAARHAFGILLAQVRGNRAATTASNMLAKVSDDLLKQVLRARGIPLQKLLECHADIERLASLAGGALAPGDRVSKGGILLNS